MSLHEWRATQAEAVVFASDEAFSAFLAAVDEAGLVYECPEWSSAVTWAQEAVAWATAPSAEAAEEDAA